MSGHTPGPWLATCCDVKNREREFGDDGVRFWDVTPDSKPFRGDICSVHASERIGGISLEERDANAMLIRAAPDLLSIVERFVALPCSAWHPDRHAAEEAELMTDAVAVIAKARGEQL